MNFIWAILNKVRAVDTSFPYTRKTDSAVNDIPVDVRQTVNSIVTETPESYRYFIIERLVQAAMRSPYKKELAAIDPLNTYSYPVDVDSKIQITNPTDLIVTPMPTGDKLIPVVLYNLILDVPGETIKAGNTTYLLNMTDNLSDIIALSDTLSIRIQGNVSAQVNGSNILISDIRRPSFDLADIMSRVVVPKWYNEEMRHIFTQGTTVEKLAAVLINAAEGALDG